jgi:hypothetical protein
VFFTGSDALFADFVQDDVVLVGATGLGSYTYDTQIGGSTTVPLFEVDGISHQVPARGSPRVGSRSIYGIALT